MGLVLDRRKSRSGEGEGGMSTDDMHEIFKRHFESRFMPLDGSITLQSRQESEPEAEEDVSSESEWEGLSDREDAEAPAVEVVEHTSNSTVSSSLTMSKRELKAFMSPRPPTASSSTAPPVPTTPKPEDEDPEDESAPSLLANDLALARLIRESHLLDGFRGPSSSLIPSSSAGGTPTMELHGRARLLATDMRVRALTDGNKHKASASSSVAALSSIVAAGTKSRSGGVAAIKESIYAQRNRPGLIARGIAAAAAKREEKRRREARETGQVLERFGGVSKNSKKRSKGKSGLDPGLPSVGRMRGAELKLSERDIRRIEQQGPHRSGGGRGKGGRGGRRR